MLRTITIEGFKSIQHLSLGLGRVNCLIGANGVGKSNIFESIGALGAAADSTVDTDISTAHPNVVDFAMEAPTC